MNSNTVPILLAFVPVLSLGLALSLGGAAPVQGQDAQQFHNESLVAASDGAVAFETDDVELDVGADGSVDYETGAGTDLQVETDGTLALETPEGVDLDLENGTFDLEGQGIDFRGENDVDLEATTGDVAVCLEITDGHLSEFEVGDTELDLGDGELEYDAADGPELTVTADEVEIDGDDGDYELGR